MECDVCKQAARTFKCDNCLKKLCKGCAALTSSEVKVIELKDRVMKFFCIDCNDFHGLKLLNDLVQSKQEIILSKDEIISLLKQEVKDLKSKIEANQTPTIPSFAEVVNNNSTVPMKTKNRPNLIIKPKGTQDSQETKTDIMENIKPADINVSIDKTRSSHHGSLIIKCNDTESVTKLKNEIKQKLGDYYEVEETKLRNPQIKIVGYPAKNESTTEEIEKSIRMQNSFFNDEDSFKITFIKETKLNKLTIFAECSPNLFKKIMWTKKVYIGWERYPAYENLAVKQCFKCYAYYHKSPDCPNETTCSYCGGEHNRRDCNLSQSKENRKCVNCERSNKKYKTNHNLKHEATDPQCPTNLYHLEVLKSKINYG